MPEKSIVARLYRMASGREPVREWLLGLSAADRKVIGRDLMRVEFGWPCGKPLCDSLSSYPGLWEVRSNLTGRRIARVIFYISGEEMVLLQGFMKTSRATPLRDLKLANRRMKEHKRHG